MKLKKAVFIVVVAIFALGLLGNSAEAVVDVNIGVVNLQQVVENHPAAEEIEEEMQQELMQLQQQFEEELDEIDTDDTELVQQLQQQVQQQAEIIQQQKMNEMMEVLRPELDEFREEEGYDIILMDDSVLSGGEDITEEIIEYIQ